MINDAFTLPTYHYLDISGSYRFKDGLVLVAGINNLLDKDPQISPSVGNDTAFRGTYDALGRSVYSTLRFHF